MLYLIESGNYLKIGYTNNIKQRIKSYNTTNPDFKVIDTMEGTQDTEKRLHRILAKYKYKNEWFYNNSEVISTWNDFKKYGIGELFQNIQFLKEDYVKLELLLKKEIQSGKSRDEINTKRFLELTEHIVDLNKAVIQLLKEKG